jgi:hypothetical protein
MSATPDRAQRETGPKPDSLRSTRAGAIWTALPARDQHLLLWLLGGDIVTAQACQAPCRHGVGTKPDTLRSTIHRTIHVTLLNIGAPCD